MRRSSTTAFAQNVDRSKRNASRRGARRRRKRAARRWWQRAARQGQSRQRRQSQRQERRHRQGECRVAGTKANVGAARRRSTRRWSAGGSRLISRQAGATRVASQHVSTRSRRQAARSDSSQTSYAPSAVESMASTIPMQQIVPVFFPSPFGSQSSQQPET